MTETQPSPQQPDLPVPSNTPDTKPGKKLPTKKIVHSMRKFFTQKGGVWADFLELCTSLLSSDQPTRRMTFLFFLSLFGLILVIGVSIERYWAFKKDAILMATQRKTNQIREMIQKEAEKIKHEGVLITLGSFRLELIAAPKNASTQNTMNMAAVDIVLLCENQTTENYVSSHIPQVRNQLTNIFTALDRNELLSKEGKKKFKMVILRKLNDWLPQGRIQDVYFSKLIVN